MRRICGLIGLIVWAAFTLALTITVIGMIVIMCDDTWTTIGRSLTVAVITK